MKVIRIIIITLGVIIILWIGTLLVVSGLWRNLPGGRLISHSSSDWITFSPPSGDFSVSSPAVLADTPETMDFPLFGPVQRHRYHVNWHDSYFAVERVDYPADFPILDRSQGLDAARDGAITATQGHLIEESPITLGRIAGRQLKVSMDRGRLLATARLYLVGRRLYEGIVVRRSSVAEDDTRRFLNSLHIIGE
jgi:hypothetical protein